MKLEEVCHDLNLQQTRFIDNGPFKNEIVSKEKINDSDIVPFKVFKNQIESNYNEIQLATAKKLMQKMGTSWGCKKVDVDTQTHAEFIDKEVYVKL